MKKLWKDRLSFRDNVCKQLPELAADFFKEGRKALGPDTSWDEKHQFRLRAKRFRYTLEIFRSAYGPAMDIRIDSVKKVQTLLGDINDCVVTAEMVRNFPGAAAHLAKLTARTRALNRKLDRYWAEVFDAPGQEQHWCAYLRRYACLPRRSRTLGTQA